MFTSSPFGDQQNAIKSNGFASSDFQFLDLQVFTWERLCIACHQ